MLVSDVTIINSLEVIRYNVSLTDYRTGSNSYSWICGDHFISQMNVSSLSFCEDHIKNINTNVNTWTVYWDDTLKVKYCLSQGVDEQCRVQFSLLIMIVVILCNFVKAVALMIVLMVCNKQPLVTIGDAIASFLTSQDVCTQRRCLTTVFDCRSMSHSGFVYSWPVSISKRWQGCSQRWFHGASETRWAVCNIL